MKKIICYILFISISVTSYSQVDYSIFLQKKISKKDMEGFTNLSKFKKYQYSKCLKGNCKNGKSLLKLSFLERRVRNTKITHTVIVDGMFKNGKLNGEVEIFYYTKFFYNEVKGGVYSSANVKLPETKYHEYIKANFKDNVAAKGEYIVRLKEEVFDSKMEQTLCVYTSDKTILMDFVEKPNFVKYFDDWDYNDKLLSYKYKGAFNSLSILDAKQFEKLELFYTSLFGTNNRKDYTITIKPLEKENTYTFTQKLKAYYNKTTITKAKQFSIINGECDGCWLSDMTLDEHKQYVLDKKQWRKKHNEKLDKQRIAGNVKKALPFVGHFITNGFSYYYIQDVSEDTGCLYVNQSYPFKNNSVYRSRYFDECDYDDFFILKNASVCTQCHGEGEEQVKVLHTTTYYTTDNAGNRTYDKSPSRSGYINETHSCSVCGGSGIKIGTKN